MFESSITYSSVERKSFFYSGLQRICSDCTNVLPLRAVGGVANMLVKALMVASFHPLPEISSAYCGSALFTSFLGKEARMGEAK
jgi:hypothetical protein